MTYHFQGIDAHNLLVREARCIINSSYFTRESRNFTPEDYCSKHIRAQLQLTQAKHGRQPHEQVQDFLNHMDYSLNFIKTTIISHAEASQDLFKAARLFKSLYEATKATGDERGIPNRAIGGMHGFGRGYGRDNGRGRGRGYGREGGRGRGNFGRGYGNYYGRGEYFQGNGENGGQDDSLFLSQDILAQMNPMQRKAFFTGRDVIQQQYDDPATGNDDPRIVGGQHINGQHQEQEQTNQNLQQQVQQPHVKFSNASDQFGRSGRQLQGRGGGKNK